MPYIENFRHRNATRKKFYILIFLDFLIYQLSRETSTASQILPTLRRIRDFLSGENNIRFPLELGPFVGHLVDSINSRVRKLVDNKLLRISVLLDPRFAFDESIFSKAHWALIEEDLLEFANRC